MGFSTVAAGVILAIGILFLGTMVLNATFDAQRTVMHGIETEHEIRAMALQSAATVTATSHTGPDLRIWATNSGATTLDAARIAVLIDGIWSNPLIVEKTIDGRTGTDVWAPEQELFLRLDVGMSIPGRAYLVLETGTGLAAMI